MGCSLDNSYSVVDCLIAFIGSASMRCLQECQGGDFGLELFLKLTRVRLVVRSVCFKVSTTDWVWNVFFEELVHILLDWRIRRSPDFPVK